MEQTLEYLSHGNFQYCNICFCQESGWNFSITVALFVYAKKTFKVFHLEMRKCCYQSLCGCYSFGSDSLIPTIHHAPWRVILLLEGKLPKFIAFTLLSLPSPQRSSLPTYCPCFLPLQWRRDHQGVQGEEAAVCGGVGKQRRMWWRSRARAGSRADLPDDRERKNIVAPHSYSFPFHSPDKRTKKWI